MPKKKPGCYKTKHYSTRDAAIGHRKDLEAKGGILIVNIYYCKIHNAWHVGRKKSNPYARRVR